MFGLLHDQRQPDGGLIPAIATLTGEYIEVVFSTDCVAIVMS